MKMPQTAVKAKRLVVEDEGGFTIIGMTEGELPLTIGIPLEEEKFLTVSLVKVKPRYAIYRPFVAPATGRFNDTFNPAQV